MWVRVAVTRLLHNLAARGPKEAPLPDALAGDLHDAAADPELAQIKQTYREEFTAAFRAAVDSLDVADRVLLHQSITQRRTQAALAEAYDVHINTIARWIRRARTALEAAVREQLASRLKVTDTQFRSLLALVRSRLDLSLGALEP